MRALTLASLSLTGALALGGCATYSNDPPVAATSQYLPDDAPRPGYRLAARPDADAYAVKSRATLDPAATVASQPSDSRVESAIRAIRDAKTLDEAVDAYAAGMTVDRDNVAIHKEYLRKVVDLDAPALGVTAAERVITTDPGNGLARAALADDEARHGSMATALTDISLAVRKASSEPFVQRTAGHLMAWYDNNPRPPQLSASVRESLSQVNKSLETSPGFTEAYRDATNYFRQERERASRNPTTNPAGGPSTQPATPEAGAGFSDDPGYTGGGIGYSPSNPPYSQPSYTQPYAVYNNYYDYPSGYYGPYYNWWPTLGFFGYYDFGFGRGYYHHGWDHDRDHDRGFRDRYFGHGSDYSRANGRGGDFARTNSAGGVLGASRYSGRAYSGGAYTGASVYGRGGYLQSNSAPRYTGTRYNSSRVGSSRFTPSIGRSFGSSRGGFGGGFHGGFHSAGISHGGGGGRR